MGVIRARTIDLKQMGPLTKERSENSRLNGEEALAGRTVLTSYPRRLVLEMTSACNIHCKMCGRSAADFKPTFFQKEWLELLQPAASRVEEVTLLGWGEPTLHPEFTDFLKWGDSLGLRKFFCTNGTRLKQLKEAVFENHVELLTVSLDGACAGTNNRIRCGADFTAITSDIREIVAEKERRGSKYPYISIVMTMMESNYREFPEFVRLAGKLGLEEAKGVYLTVFEDRLMEECMYGKQDGLRKVFEEAEQAGEEWKVAVKLPYLQGEDVAGDKAHKDCYAGWRDFFLGSDGYVRPCMSTSKKLFPVSKYQSLDQMWNSVEYQEFRSRVNSARMDIPCQNCYQASFANWNRKSAFVQVGKDFAPEWEKQAAGRIGESDVYDNGM